MKTTIAQNHIEEIAKWHSYHVGIVAFSLFCNLNQSINLHIFTTLSETTVCTIFLILQEMQQRTNWVIFFSLFFLLHVADSENDEAKRSLVNFFFQLSRSNGPRDPSWGWNMSSDPCTDQWKGITCDKQSATHVTKIELEGLDLNGNFDATSLCDVESLVLLSIKQNSVNGEITGAIGNCKQLTHLYLSYNRLSDSLPESLASLKNLKKLDISNNNLSGKLPNLPRISGLSSFLAQNNHLIGRIPQLDFSNLQEFNVSNNNFSGRVPDLQGKYSVSSISGNPGLCGPPLPNSCPPRSRTIEHLFMYSGYAVLGIIFFIFIAFKYSSKKQSKEDIDIEDVKKPNNDQEVEISTNMTSDASIDYKSGISTKQGGGDGYSMTSSEQSAMISSSMVVVSSPVVKGLKFEDLLKAPAELLGRGKHGSLYKIILEDGTALVVKRIKDWAISSEYFKKRMQKIDQVRHPNVLPVVAFYCSKQEKLIVYEYQEEGSLFTLLQGAKNGGLFDWSCRLNIATSIAESLEFMHKELENDGIGHGNLKSSNILLNKKKDPCLSEYGLMLIENQDYSSLGSSSDYKIRDQEMKDGVYSTFKVDMHGFGIILLELLTGKLHHDGFDLGRWVHSVVREEWTAEVFDKALIEEGVSEERMVNLLHVALKCVNPSPEARPSINEVAVMIHAIKDEDQERSV